MRRLSYFPAIKDEKVLFRENVCRSSSCTSGGACGGDGFVSGNAFGESDCYCYCNGNVCGDGHGNCNFMVIGI